MSRNLGGVVLGLVTRSVVFPWLAMKVSGRREAVWILAGILVLHLVSIHLLLEWSRFPWWYSLGVVIPCVPAILLGSRWASSGRCVEAPN